VQLRFLAIVCLVVGHLASAQAAASACEAYYPFDGSLDDAGGNGYHGELRDRQDEPAIGARFAPGVAGQALRLNGNHFVRTPLNLQIEDCPRVTITAWIFLEDGGTGTDALVSTGYGRGPALERQDHKLAAFGESSKLAANHALRPGVWTFVASTWDFEAGVHRLYWNNRYVEQTLKPRKRPPQEYFWIGARAYLAAINDIADGVLLDEVRVFDRVLASVEIAGQQKQQAPRAVAAAPIPADQQTFTQGSDCDAHYPFNGNLRDVSGNRFHGLAVDLDAGPAPGSIEYVPGRFGQAIRLDGTSALMAPLDLHYSLCPRVTITAWVYFEEPPSGTQTLLSTGFGSGPRIDTSGSGLKVLGGRSKLLQKDVFQPGQWTFVAASWDFPAGVHRLRTAAGEVESPLGEFSRPPQPELWLGVYAYNQSMLGAIEGVRLDDVRVFGRLLDDQELSAVQTQQGPDDKYALPARPVGRPDGPVGQGLATGDLGGRGGFGGGPLEAARKDAADSDAASPPRTLAEREADIEATQALAAGTTAPELTAPGNLPGELPATSEAWQEAAFEEYQRQRQEEAEFNFGVKDRMQVVVGSNDSLAYGARSRTIFSGPGEPRKIGVDLINAGTGEIRELLRLKGTEAVLRINKAGPIPIQGYADGRHVDLIADVEALTASGRPIDLVAEGDGAYLIVSGYRVVSKNAPTNAVIWAKQQLRLRAPITAFAFLGDGAWIGASTRGVTTEGLHARHYGSDLRDRASQLFAAGERIDDVSSSWTILDDGTVTGDWAIATDQQIYYENAEDCDNHESFGVDVEFRLGGAFQCHVPVPPCPHNRNVWHYSNLESPADPDVWDINVRVTVGVSDYDGEEKARIDCWLEESFRQTEALFDRSPRMRIHARTRRAETIGGRDLSVMQFADDGDYRNYMEDNFDIVAPTETSGYFQIVLVDEMCIGTVDGRPNCGIGGRATFPHAVAPFSRKYGIMMEYIPDDQGLMAHEFGHYLGLKHTFEPYGITTNTCNKDYDANWLKMEERHCRSCLSGMDLANDTCDGLYNVMDYCENPEPPQQVYVNDCQQHRAMKTRERYTDGDGKTRYGKMKGAK